MARRQRTQETYPVHALSRAQRTADPEGVLEDVAQDLRWTDCGKDEKKISFWRFARAVSGGSTRRGEDADHTTNYVRRCNAFSGTLGRIGFVLWRRRTQIGATGGYGWNAGGVASAASRAMDTAT
ncbi:unnamed protein product [Peniophora sp. CBMAI 1063]|nr:unnamed protein product [Peniophora sp. CBMAI 1063]